mmetsp:Transcript_23786/g.39117  ORF Transcript_23786/g.39117 Transcript_23786/m.39117 type:complete len:472 (+) Transcript_23786:233-1648(+)|eukprot:CAMPEP_0184665818 /NCGR_PEP_ID=MMETSP0308-20130426/58744_1 /TAXON_ID=38269 /ORGANISM="Gloeochaete witrockiana, Strain SAG 46.84" /LENGTH=471 /DNA_ID=CAMNT_0027110037 /DNA_START=162 /DNA_END=1577 /DNA_ORIENTATION=+
MPRIPLNHGANGYLMNYSFVTSIWPNERGNARIDLCRTLVRTSLGKAANQIRLPGRIFLPPAHVFDIVSSNARSVVTDTLPQWAEILNDRAQWAKTPPQPLSKSPSAVRPTIDELVASPAFWHGPDVAAKSDEWIHVLSQEELGEIRSAIAHARRKHQGTPNEDIVKIIEAKEDFPLSKEFEGLLEEVFQKLVNGRGFFLIRGLPVREWSIEDLSLAYFGLGSYLGDAVTQNRRGHVLGHVKDVGDDPSDPSVRIYRTHERQPFHADACDIVGLLALRTAKEGGASYIASSYAVYHELLTKRPDLLAVLEDDEIYWDRKNDVPTGKGDFFKGPMFVWHKGRVCCLTNPDRAFSAQRHPDVPRMSDLQKEAFLFVEETCIRDDISFNFQLQEGDIEFAHNPHVLHARSWYVDHADPAERRHLLRLWLSNTNRGIELPDVPYTEWFNGPVTVGQRRGGVYVKGVQPRAPMEAE